MRLFFEEYGGVIFLIIFFMVIIGILVSKIAPAAKGNAL